MYELSVFKTKDILKVQTHLTFSLLIIRVFFFIYELSIKINCLNLMSFFWLAKVKSAELRISRQG